MIKLNPRSEIPEKLQTNRVDTILSRIRQKVRNKEKIEADDFSSDIWRHDEVRLNLHDHQHGKCCYCENIREPKRELDIEHYRPKGSVAESNGKHTGYWWLAYNWDNLFLACKYCNQEYKKDSFPLIHEEQRAWFEHDKIENEDPKLLNPINDNPEEYITFRYEEISIPLAIPVPVIRDDEERGQATIKILGLDRNSLNEERGDKIRLLKGILAKMYAGEYLGNSVLLNQAKKDILRETRATKQFAGFCRAYFRSLGLGAYVAND